MIFYFGGFNVKIQKGNIILNYSEEQFIKSTKKNSLFREIIRSIIVVIISMITFVLEMSLFNKFLPGNKLLEFIVIGFTICLIIYIYTLVCMYINKDNKNYYFIYNMLNINKCKALKFYDKIIVLYEQNNEMHSMSLSYIVNNMLDKNIEIIDNSDDTISSIYIDTLENKIIINGVENIENK